MEGVPQSMEEVLRELDAIAQGQLPEQQTLMARFVACPDWQQASELVARAVDASQRSRRRARLLPAPPGCLLPG